MKLNIRSKIALCLTAAALLVGNLAVLPSAETDSRTEYGAEIMNVKGGADAIATLTFDDGKHDTASKLVPLLQKNGISASLMVVPSRIEGTPPYNTGYSTVAQLSQFLASGYIDIQSHSYSHLYMHDSGENAANNTAANIEEQIPTSKTYLESKFPSVDSISMAVPGGKYSTDATNRMMEVFYSARNENGTAYKNSTYNVQSLNPADSASQGGWYNPYTLWLNQNNEDVINTYLGMCIEEGGWFIVGAHYFAGSDADVNQGSLKDFTEEWLDSFLASLKARVDNGELWVATMSEATKYLREYQNSTVTEYQNSEGLFVELTMKDKTERGMALSRDVFDMPLTIKAEIPEGWAKVRCSAGGVETIVDSFTEGGKTYAYLDVVPGSGRVYLTDGEKEVPKTEVNAQLMNVKGGASAIATMTFDDGLMPTANKLNELLAEYNLRASLMLVTSRINNSKYFTTEQWNEVFSKGYLEPQSHSKNHDKITSGAPENNTPENIYDEIVGSLNTLNAEFPNFDHLTYAVPNSNYTADAKAVLMQNYYAARMGTCVITQKPGKMQSLNPNIGFSTGGWYDPYIVRMQPISNANITTQQIVDYLTKCVNEGGWFQGFAHGLEGCETSGVDLSVDDARAIFSAMKNYVDQGKLWVATFSDATKYIREYQNSTVSAYTTVQGMFVDVTMADKTADNLPLTASVFNMPLTVKIQLPANWGKISYTQNGVTSEAYAFSEGGINFAYIDVVPNGGTVNVTNEGDPTDYVQSLGIKQNVTIDSAISHNIYIPTDSYVSAVKLGGKDMVGDELENGYTVYSFDNIYVTEINRKYSLTLEFDVESGYGNYTFTVCCLSYLGQLAESDAVSDEEKQLVYDFTVFAKESYAKFADSQQSSELEEYDTVLEKLDGFTSSADSYGTPSDIGTMANVIDSVAFAINEKPYYVFDIAEGFTGTLTLTVGETTEEFKIVNGYYHCKRYVVFEIAGVYDLMGELSVLATGTVGDTAVSAEGAYSLSNYAEGLSTGGAVPSYVKALYSYAKSAREFIEE